MQIYYRHAKVYPIYWLSSEQAKATSLASFLPDFLVINFISRMYKQSHGDTSIMYLTVQGPHLFYFHQYRVQFPRHQQGLLTFATTIQVQHWHRSSRLHITLQLRLRHIHSTTIIVSDFFTIDFLIFLMATRHLQTMCQSNCDILTTAFQDPGHFSLLSIFDNNSSIFISLSLMLSLKLLSLLLSLLSHCYTPLCDNMIL